ncbi:O-antigen ligase family protein [Sphingomonas sp. CFBP 13706]|uniref:O-antigen ligase family protein n=1 Tax=Sphingomonas sp. CFBP 13706 TaxID=2775314 RepID=UPI00177E1B8D|nr:O-antigen ligase family protein [Sphingomonas sp. CFBP 13706]MBD8737382.1 O-antigen ligase family protein [Sphingomonas sp. CFBP 13706]
MSLNSILVLGLLVAIWVAGGASRADELGQAIVRTAAWIAIVVTALFGARPSLSKVSPALWIILAALVLVLVQLIPLPPAIWQVMPGRLGLANATKAIGMAEVWRPIAIVPGAAVNAAASLVVPFAILLLVAGLDEREIAWLPAIVLGMAAATALLGLLQFSGAGFNNPFVNDSPGQVSGNFANRNHFALLLAVGCLVAPVWAFQVRQRLSWRVPVAVGLVVLFVLLILASGSRAGLLIGVLAIVMALLLVRNAIQRERRHLPRWVFPVIVMGSVLTIGLFVLLSIGADRAISVDRLFQMEAGEDLRTRNMPTVLRMIGTYFPVGSGFGGFDPVFRIHEPLAMLKLTYFNHAHNDFLEVALDGGFGALVLLVAVLIWWVVASIRAWRGGADVAKLGSAMLALVFVAAAFDYAARTPIMMTIIVIAAIWLGTPRTRIARTPLPAAAGQL